MEFQEFTNGTFIWFWFHSLTGLNAMVLSLIVAGLVLGLTRWTPVRTFLKAVVATGFIATLPLGLIQLGFDIPRSNDETIAYLSFLGSIVAIGVGIPYFFHQMLRAASGRYTTYVGKTVQYTGSHAIRQTGAAGEAVESTGDKSDFLSDISPQTSATKEENTVPATVTWVADGRTVGLGSGTTTIGRASDNDIVIDDPTVSRYHAQITHTNGGYYLEDLGSMAGTAVDGKRKAREQVTAGSILNLGNTEIKFNGVDTVLEQPESHPAAPSGDSPITRFVSREVQKTAWLAVTGGPAMGQTYHLSEGNNRIGRDPSNDLSLEDPFVSRSHAVVRVENGKTYLVAMGSNGETKVNGKRIQSDSVGQGSSIKIGETELELMQVEQPQLQAQGTANGNTLHDTRGQQAGLLVVKAGVDSGKSYMIKEGDNVIGRDLECSVTLTDDSVSRQHAVLRLQNGKLTLFDLGSTSGTELDGRPVRGNLLQRGDLIEMGKSQVILMANPVLDLLTV